MHTCCECEKPATHSMATGLDGDTPRRYARQRLEDTVYFCPEHAEEHPSAEEMPPDSDDGLGRDEADYRDDVAFEAGGDAWKDYDDDPYPEF